MCTLVHLTLASKNGYSTRWKIKEHLVGFIWKTGQFSVGINRNDTLSLQAVSIRVLNLANSLTIYANFEIWKIEKTMLL